MTFTDVMINLNSRFLVRLGMISSAYYIAINVFVPFWFPGYSLVSQTVSELSAINAPTRPLWVSLASIYIIMFGAFAWGVWSLGPRRSRVRTIGTVMLIYAIINIYWPPMHLRGSLATLTDTLHIVWAMATVGLMISLMILGMNLFGTAFRYYTIATLAIHLFFGTLTAIDGPNIATNLPTPWIGLWERINIAAFMIWVAVLSRQLLKMDATMGMAPKTSTNGFQ